MSQKEYSALPKAEKRKLKDPLKQDRYIHIEGLPDLELGLRFNQVEYKTPKHGKSHGLPVGDNGKTPKTEALVLALLDSLVNMSYRLNVIVFTEGQYQGQTSRGCNAVNIFDPDTNLIAVYQEQLYGSYLFLTTCGN